MIATNTFPHPPHATPALPVGSGGHVVTAKGRAIPPESLERLERLDDTIFAALAGDPEALDAANTEWRLASETVEPHLLDESRRQYLRRALAVWRRYERQPQEQLARGFAAMEIRGLLESKAA